MSNVVPLHALPEAIVEQAVLVGGFEDIPAVMAPKTLADLLDVTTKTLERWRDAKTGPAHHKLPGSSLIRYTRTDVLTWLASCRAEPGS